MELVYFKYDCKQINSSMKKQWQLLYEYEFNAQEMMTSRKRNLTFSGIYFKPRIIILWSDLIDHYEIENHSLSIDKIEHDFMILFWDKSDNF